MWIYDQLCLYHLGYVILYFVYQNQPYKAFFGLSNILELVNSARRPSYLAGDIPKFQHLLIHFNALLILINLQYLL